MTIISESSILTKNQIQEFWDKHSIDNELSTRGMRLLILHCFKLPNKDASIWEKRTFDNWYTGFPLHAFWLQSEDIQEDILMMLETNKIGRKLVKEFIQKISAKVLIDLLKESGTEKKKPKKLKEALAC